MKDDRNGVVRAKVHEEQPDIHCVCYFVNLCVKSRVVRDCHGFTQS